VRIAAGRWKGRKLEVPDSARPTSSRAREALFDILGPRITGARVLDLFAGSGAVGFEAVSRGAARAVLVDTDAEPLRRARASLDAGEDVLVLASDAASALADLGRRGERFDVVFADPPYRDGERAARDLSGIARLLSPGGVLVVQTDSEGKPPFLEGFAPVSSRVYGRNVFHFLRIL
jgi:16S rRNA (guanine(966)-N(2))-methyltransferase RsmD